MKEGIQVKFGLREKIMWNIFKNGYERELINTLHISKAGDIMNSAYSKYKEMILSVTEYKRQSRFIGNIIIASILGSIYISLDSKPDIGSMTAFNCKALMNNKMMLKSIISEMNYTEKGQQKIAEDALLSMSDDNPFSWQYTYEKGGSIMQYSVFFKTCGILYLYKVWGIKELTPAMCRLDYDMAAANNTIFTRENTLADGGECCDCHYNHTKGIL